MWSHCLQIEFDKDYYGRNLNDLSLTQYDKNYWDRKSLNTSSSKLPNLPKTPKKKPVSETKLVDELLNQLERKDKEICCLRNKSDN